MSKFKLLLAAVVLLALVAIALMTGNVHAGNADGGDHASYQLSCSRLSQYSTFHKFPIFL
jgi:hypothetical protein